MTDAASPDAAMPERRAGRLPLILGLVGAIAGAGGAFYVAWSGLLAGDGSQAEVAATGALPDVTFVPVEPLVVSLPTTTGTRQLRFASQIEVAPEHAGDVVQLMPRVLDVMNSYLRAIEPARFEEPGALLRIRAQLLRRLQIVTGEGRVRDLLVTEFVIQ